MDAITTLRTLRRRGYTATVGGGRLKLRGPAKPPEELEAYILEHRDKLVRLVEGEIVVDEREVFDMARSFFGKSERGSCMTEKNRDRTAETLYEALFTDDGDTNLTDAILGVGRALQLLGNADASTPMGALEAHGKAVLEASENIAGGLHNIADAIREASEKG